MALTDYSLTDQNGASFRAELNTILSIIVANNSHATTPTTTFAYMFWADTTSGILKMRNAANSAWINLWTIAGGAPGLTDANVFTKTQTWKKGGDLASAATVTLGTDGQLFDITGTDTVTVINGVAGTMFMLQFDGVLTFTHHATNLIIPGGANITTAPGDVCIGWMLTTSTALILHYQRANGKAIITDADTLEIRHQANTTNATKTGVKIQAGWGFIDGGGATRINENITFPTAFSTELLSLNVTFIGAKVGSDPSTILDFGTSTDNVIETRALTSSLSVFTAEIHSDAVLTSGTRYGYSWIATGK